VGPITFRPSQRTQFEARLARLEPFKRDELAKLVLGRTQASSPFADVLDAAIDYMDFKHPEDLIKADSLNAQWKQQLLISRAKLRSPSEPLRFDPPLSSQPQSGHRSTRVHAGGGLERGPEGYAELGFRFALHDLLDPLDGYPANAHLEMMSARARYYPGPGRIELEELTVARIRSLNPVHRFQRGISWQLDAGVKRLRDENCARCVAGQAVVGAGYSWRPAPWLAVFGFGNFELAYSPSFYASDLRIGVGPEAGLIAGGDRLRLLLDESYRYTGFAYFPHVWTASAEARWSFASGWAVSARTAAFNASGLDVGGTLYFYF
jgi:hypothetical protein